MAQTARGRGGATRLGCLVAARTTIAPSSVPILTAPSLKNCPIAPKRLPIKRDHLVFVLVLVLVLVLDLEMNGPEHLFLSSIDDQAFSQKRRLLPKSTGEILAPCPSNCQALRRYVARRVTLSAGVDPRELALEKNANLLRERIEAGLLPAATPADSPLLPILNTFEPEVSTSQIDYVTTRPVYPMVKSHLNVAVLRSSWERAAIDILEDLDCVEAYAPNDRKIGFQIPYVYQGAPRRYEPDFIVRLVGGMQVVLEIKGGQGEIHDEDRVLAKSAAARKWCQAVTNTKRFGRWTYEICRDLEQLRATLEQHAVGARVLPFRKVEPAAGDHYRTCIPYVPLRAAAGRWSEDQTLLDPSADAASEWVTWDRHRPFTPGMFVAQVVGRSMEPGIPSGSYCLFRPVPVGSQQGKKLLVWHSGIADPETGGQYTVKIYTSEQAVTADGGWEHVRIVLKPENPEFQPIVLTPADEHDLRVIAEVVEVLGGGGNPPR